VATPNQKEEAGVVCLVESSQQVKFTYS